VDVTMDGETLRLSEPELVLERFPLRLRIPVNAFDIGPDGSMYGPGAEDVSFRWAYAVSEISLSFNFASELERRFADEGG